MSLRKPTAEEQRYWNRKLSEVGFRDAEEFIAGEYVLKQTAEHPYRGTDDLTRQTKAAYYRLLSQQSHDTEFPNEAHKLILTMYADGAKIRDIGAALDAAGIPRCRNTIRFTIRKYEMAWGLREYTPRQLNKARALNRVFTGFWRWCVRNTNGKKRKRFKRHARAPLDRFFRGAS